MILAPGASNFTARRKLAWSSYGPLAGFYFGVDSFHTAKTKSQPSLPPGTCAPPPGSLIAR